MKNQPFPQDEHKFDTLSLLAGLTEEDIKGYSLEDILNEYGGRAEAPIHPQDAMKPAVREPVRRAPEPAPVAEEAEKPAKKEKKKKKWWQKAEKQEEAPVPAAAPVPMQPAAPAPAPAPAPAAPLPDFLMGNLEEVAAPVSEAVPDFLQEKAEEVAAPAPAALPDFLTELAEEVSAPAADEEKTVFAAPAEEAQTVLAAVPAADAAQEEEKAEDFDFEGLFNLIDSGEVFAAAGPAEAPAAEESPAEEVPAAEEPAAEEAVAEISVAEEPAAEEESMEEESFIDQIQMAIDRDLELNQATPEPVIHVIMEDPGLGDPELDAIFKDKPVRAPEQLPPDPSLIAAPVAPASEKEEEPDLPPVPSAPDLKVVAPPEPVPTAAELYKKNAKSIRPSRLRMTAVLVLTVLAVILTAINQFGWSNAVIFASNKIVSKILLGIMVLCAVLCVDIIKTGVKSIFSLHFTAESMMTLIFLVAAIDAILCGDENPIPFCAVACMQFYFAAWGSMLRKISIRRSLRPLFRSEQKAHAVTVVENVWEGGSVAAPVEEASEEEHVRGLLRTDLAESRMRIYAPISIVLTLALAFLVRFKTGNSLTWAWSSMMIGALPVASFISFYRPFAILSARLMKEGAAISGWSGAQRMASAKGAVVTDEDVFPNGSVKINGMKVYGSYSVGQTVGYAAAVIEASGSGLTPLFRELRNSNNGRFFTVSQFRRYEGGGYGAEIAGDVVLVGSLRFMQLMGVYMHEGTRVRNAIYLSVNGEMCAVFSLSYGGSAKARKGLRQIVAVPGIAPVFATKDFLITPLLVEERYKIPNASLEFPSVEERNKLSHLPGNHPAAQSAILTKGGFGIYADAVVGGRILRSVTAISSIINIAAGLVGIGLMFLLTWLGAMSAVTAMNMLLFALVWTLPVIILAGWLGRY
ncbi:MAG: hypothetical protein IJP11_04590 [Oscillospiraceae bacterium]|nr:hypothetical protein [Oscillospiraceae bacterium]